MMKLEIEPTKKEEFDLSPLGEMVGVQKALQQLISRGEPGEEEVGQVLKAQQESYAKLPRFRDKASALKEIINFFSEGKIGVDEILEEAGVVTKIPTGEGKRGIWGRVLDKLGRR